MKPLPGPVALLVALAVLGVVFGIAERFWSSVPGKSKFRRERVTDFLYWFVTPWLGGIASRIGIIAAVVVVTVLVRAITGREPSPAWFTQQHVALQIIELLVAADFLGYFAHRLFHGRRLWPFHAIHHSAEDLDWLAATRLHPLNEVGNRLLQVVPLYFLGFRGTALAAIVPVFTLYAIFLHANVRWDFGPLRYVIASPLFHRWHHTKAAERRDRNFAGLFPWIDALFGTLYMPANRQPAIFGVDDPVPSGLLAQLAYPFRRR